MTNRYALAASILGILAGLASPVFAQVTTSYLVSWEANPEPDITGYIIYRSLTPADPNPTPIDTVGASTLSFVDAGRLPGTAYYYRIKAMNASGQTSTFSNICSGFTVPQNASDAVKNLCRVTAKTKTGDSSYDISWSTSLATMGFVQYDRDAVLDSTSAWDEGTYATNHTVPIGGLVSPSTYYVRAVAYDSSDNMFISAIDTFAVNNEQPQPLATPHISIYPVPYRPAAGTLALNDLPAGGAIAVLNGNGVEVWSATVGAETSITWNGMNNQGSPAASGVYYAIVKDATGAVVEKRPIMIVR